MNKSLFKKLIRTFFLSGFCCSLLLLSGCQLDGVLSPMGLVAAEEKYILILSVVLMLLIVVPTIFLVNYFAWRYRASNPKGKYSPEWGHSTLLEIICWSVPCIIIGILATITWITSHRLDPYRPLEIAGKPITIQAISLQWKWLFIYPEQDIATINYVQFPVGVPVRFLISAEGPMNGIQIPQLGSQIYAMAGMQTKLHLIANKVGDYHGISTNITGEGFAGMTFTARASSQEEFDQWVKTAKKSPQKLTLEVYNKLVEPTEYDSVKYFSAPNKKIFDWVVMKSMMPMPTPEMHTASQ